MRRVPLFLLPLPALLLATGCATIFPPRERLIRVTSFPEGTTVLLDGEPAGVTPCFISVRHRSPGSLAFEKEGHERSELQIGRAVNGRIWFNLLWMTAFLPLTAVSHAATDDASWRDDFAIAGGITAAGLLGSFMVDDAGGNSSTHSTASIHVTLRKREAR